MLIYSLYFKLIIDFFSGLHVIFIKICNYVMLMWTGQVDGAEVDRTEVDGAEANRPRKMFSRF